MQQQKVVNWFFFIPRPKIAQALPCSRFVFDDFVILSQVIFDFWFVLSCFSPSLFVLPHLTFDIALSVSVPVCVSFTQSQLHSTLCIRIQFIFFTVRSHPPE
jgi:hypothetical protein